MRWPSTTAAICCAKCSATPRRWPCSSARCNATRTTPRPTTIWAARWSTCTGTRRRCCVSNARCDWRRTIWTPTTTWATRCNCWVAPAPRCAATRALAIAPDDVEARVNAGICRLLQGDLQGGWRWYESRWRRLPLPDHAPPQWCGDAPLAGKTILVYAEQGLGDTIQMCRYVALLAAQGADVVLRVQPALKALLSQLAGARMVLADGEPLPAFDYHCSLMSLPFAFDTSLATIPAGAPYLRADPARAAAWAQRLGAPAGRRIGLAWSGNRGHDRDGSRSIPLMQLRGLFGADAQFVSLQPELRAIDRIVLENDQRIASHAAQLTDFAETAALIAQLDLVISVDTSVAHLAAAMGKPVWLLLAYAPDWRWLLERDDSPWYPTMRLFRQSVRGDWDGVVAEVAHALAARVA